MSLWDTIGSHIKIRKVVRVLLVMLISLVLLGLHEFSLSSSAVTFTTVVFLCCIFYAPFQIQKKQEEGDLRPLSSCLIVTSIRSTHQESTFLQMNHPLFKLKFIQFFFNCPDQTLQTRIILIGCVSTVENNP